jgi:hypothetical protein
MLNYFINKSTKLFSRSWSIDETLIQILLSIEQLALINVYIYHTRIEYYKYLNNLKHVTQPKLFQ